MDEGIYIVLGECGVKISGGQRQPIEIAYELLSWTINTSFGFFRLEYDIEKAVMEGLEVL